MTPDKQKLNDVFARFKKGKLNAGSKTGPVVTDRKQAIAIALRQAGGGR